MNGTTTRARTERTTNRYGAYTSGANALQVEFDDDIDEIVPTSATPTRTRPRRTDPKRRTDAPRRAEPARRSQAIPRQRRESVERPAEQTAPQVAPQPVALPRASFLLVMITIVVVGVVGVLILNTKINENAFRLDNLRAQQAALDLQEQKLTQELADRESTGNLAAAAARLGLVPADTAAFLTIPDGRVIEVPQPGSAQSTNTSDAGR